VSHTYLSSFFFLYSVISSSFTNKPDVPKCVPLPCQGEKFVSNEDCTKAGCRGTPCSFIEACYGEFCAGLPL
jgi:hypothetical protein